MKIDLLLKQVLLLLCLTGIAACSSTGEDADAMEEVAETESGVDATTRRQIRGDEGGDDAPKKAPGPAA